MRRLLVFAGLGLVPCIDPDSAQSQQGRVLRVPQDYATIQTAITAAVSGDTVLVARGTYPGRLLIAGKAITLASNYINTGNASDISQTIVSGGSPVITIEPSAADTTVQGLTLQNGGYGLRNRAARVNILNNRFINLSDAVSFEGGGGVCRDNYFDASGDDAIDSDHSSANITIENNTILNSNDDGIEIRLHPYTGPPITIVIRGNYISGSREDGIQLIDYPGLSNRQLRIVRNVIVDSAMVGLGCMPDGISLENFGGAPLQEEVRVVNNTFSGNPYAVTGGDNMLLLNNIFTRSAQTALKRARALSLASHNDFWSNGLDHSNSNVDGASSHFQDPLLDASYGLQPGSPMIDSGAVSLVWNGNSVAAPAYLGPAPDLGGREAPLGPALPMVTVTVPDPGAAELGPNPGAFAVSRTGSTAGPLAVSYSLEGTALNGTDYLTLSGSVTIAAGSSIATVALTPIDDTLPEGSETVLLHLSPDPAYALSSLNHASMTIADDDLILPTVTITATDPFAAEAGADPGRFAVTRTGATVSALTVAYDVSGNATNGLDYQAIGTSVLIPGGSTSATITVVPIDDLVVDDEEVVLTLVASPAYAVGSPGTATVTINDDEVPVSVLETRVSSSSDDAEELATSTDLTSPSLELTLGVSGNQTVGMRFGNVAIPRGATIVAAHVQFTAAAISSVATALQIAGQAADSAPAFTSGAGNISSRMRTQATLPWIPGAWTLVGAAGSAERTPDIASVIQELVARPGWASGNALAIIITGDGLGLRAARAHDGDPNGAPLLHVEYQDRPPNRERVRPRPVKRFP